MNEQKDSEASRTETIAEQKVEAAEGSSNDTDKPLRSHCYHDENGNIIARKDIYSLKGKVKGRWLRNEGGEYILKLENVKVPLYQLPILLSTKPGDVVFIVEGEKDADTLLEMGLIATTAPHCPSWFNGFNHYFEGRKVIIIPDLDAEGEKYGKLAAAGAYEYAESVQVVDLRNYYPALKEGSDISDVIEMIGPELAATFISEIAADTSEFQAAKAPKWLSDETSRYGDRRKALSEVKLAKEIKSEYGLVFVNGRFHSIEGPMQDDEIYQIIYHKVAPHIENGISSLERSVFSALKSECLKHMMEQDPWIIHCCNASLKIRKNRKIEVLGKGFSLQPLAVNFYNDAADPSAWKRFIEQIFHEDDIATIQEFLGYSLLPMNIAQKCLNIVGKGREGKTLIGIICSAIFGGAMINEQIGRISEDRFIIPQLENKHLFFDDDLDTKILRDTGLFKSLVSSEIPIQAERKGVDRYPAKIYTKFLICGNTPLASCFDKTDSFYRRLIIIRCKSVVRQEEQDDRFLSQKLLSEKEGIFLWMLEGLQRLVNNNFHFTISERSKNLLTQAIEDDINIISFLKDKEYLSYAPESKEYIKDLLTLYRIWCKRNGEIPLADRTFLDYLKQNQNRIGIKYVENMKKSNFDRTLRGYQGIAITQEGQSALIIGQQ